MSQRIMDMKAISILFAGAWGGVPGRELAAQASETPPGGSRGIYLTTVKQALRLWWTST